MYLYYMAIYCVIYYYSDPSDLSIFYYDEDDEI